MAIALVQHVATETAASQATVTATPASTGSGNMIVVSVANTGTLNTTGVTDNKGNTYQKVPNSNFTGAAPDKGDVWFCARAIAGVTSITATVSASDTSFKCIWVHEVSGMSNPVVDGAIALNGATGAGTSDPGATLLTRTANGFSVGVIVTSGGIATNPTGGNEYNAGGDIQATTGNAACSLIFSTAATHQPVWTDGASGATYGAITVAFVSSGITSIGGSSSHPGVSPGQVFPSLRFWQAPPAGVQSSSVVTINETVGNFTWSGVKAPLTIIFNSTAGQWSWVGKTSSLSTEILATKGNWTWAGKASSLSVEIVATKGTWTWSGNTSSLSTMIGASKGSYTWQGVTANLGGVVTFSAGVGSYTWQGKTSSLSTLVHLFSGQWTWVGKTSTVTTGGTGSVVIFYDGLNVADGLSYHKGLSRPHLILTPAGGGTFTIIKDVSLTDLKADSVVKETYLIDGDIP